MTDACGLPPGNVAKSLTGKLPQGLTLCHGLGAMAFGVKDASFSAFLLLFYNQVLGMDAQTVSLALALALFLDALLDPVIGYLGDRTRTRWGRRLPWLYISAIPLRLAWTLLWSRSTDNAPGFVELVALTMIVRLLISCCEVPSIALVPELTRDYDERSRLIRYRFLFSWFGGLIMLVLAYQVFLTGGLLTVEGYNAFGMAGAAIMALSVIASAIGQHRAVAKGPPPASSTARAPLGEALRDIRQVLSHPALIVVLMAEVFAFTSQGITLAVANYIFLFVWRFSDAAFQFLPLLIFASVMTTFVLVGPLHRIWGKRRTAIGCTVVSMTFWAAPFLLRAGELWPLEGSIACTALVFACFYIANLMGVCTTISLVSMVADVVEAAEEKTGRRSEGTIYAGHLLAQKCASGFGIIATGLLLGWAGLPRHAKPGEVAAPVVDSLSLGYAVLVVVFSLAIAAALRHFPIERADHEARVAALANRAASRT